MTTPAPFVSTAAPSECGRSTSLEWAAGWLHELCAVDSTSGQERLVEPLLCRLLAELGAKIERQPVAGGRRANLLARWPSPAGEGPLVLLSTHLDTVPPFLLPRRTVDGIVGRGAVDAKGQLVAQLAVIRDLLAGGERRLAWLGVVGEETDGAGARAAASWDQIPRTTRVVVNSEPTGGLLAGAQQGCLHLELETSGEAAHAAMARPGTNAIWRLHDWLGAIRELPLRQDPVFGRESINLGLLAGGAAANVVPSSARAEVIARTVPGSTFLRDCGELAPSGARLRTISSDEPLRLTVPDGWQSTVVPYGSDAPRLAELAGGCQVYQLGPGSIELAHGEHEELRWPELADGIAAIRRLCVHLLASFDSSEASS